MKKNNLFYLAIIAALLLLGFAGGRYVFPRCGAPCDPQKIYVQEFQHDTIFMRDVVSTTAEKVIPAVIDGLFDLAKEGKPNSFDDGFWVEDGDFFVFEDEIKSPKPFDPKKELGFDDDTIFPEDSNMTYTPIFIEQDLPVNRYEGMTQRGQCKVRYVATTRGYLDEFKYTVSCPRKLRQGDRFSLAGGLLPTVNKNAPFSWYFGAGFLGVEVQAIYGAGQFQNVGLGYRVSF